MHSSKLPRLPQAQGAAAAWPLCSTDCPLGAHYPLQVQKLLHKHGLMGPAHGSGANARAAPMEKEALAQLYAAHKGQPDWLDAMCEALPVPATNKQLLGWLRKHGIVAPAAKRAHRPRDPDAAVAEGNAGGSARGGVPVGGSARVGKVPQPQPTRLLGFLGAIQHAHEGNPRWGAQRAVILCVGRVGGALGKGAGGCGVCAFLWRHCSQQRKE